MNHDICVIEPAVDPASTDRVCTLSRSVLPRYIAPILDHRQSFILVNCSNFA